MSKTVLVLDRVPECCGDCCLTYMDEVGYRMCAALDGFVARGEKPLACPLRELPERKLCVPGYEDHLRAEGWNACLEAIERTGKNGTAD